jgi:hypothetical protein
MLTVSSLGQMLLSFLTYGTMLHISGDYLMNNRLYTFLAIAWATGAVAAEPIDLGIRRELFVDEFLIEHCVGARLRMHHPVPRELAVVHDTDGEGNTSGSSTPRARRTSTFTPTRSCNTCVPHTSTWDFPNVSSQAATLPVTPCRASPTACS